MLDLIAPKNTIDALVPITRFNRGEAGKIFDEVKESGYKIVVKNNIPTCVMLTPERYEKMMDIIIDQYLSELAEERLKNSDGAGIPADEVYKKFGIESDEDDSDIPMEYGVDFE
ncbi:MAG: type II toxin-antitoxin system Phd/YefM family antitoxin [Defluviitaleaceae bacterium]|nr:type II toxin-antitoxin system Phd/YefM family antitoxin [Defluviitaleaceae bacterium]